MFINDIHINRAALINLPYALAVRCASVSNDPMRINPYCDYFFNRVSFDPKTEPKYWQKTDTNQYKERGAGFMYQRSDFKTKFLPQCFGLGTDAPIAHTDMPYRDADPKAVDPIVKNHKIIYKPHPQPALPDGGLKPEEANEIVIFTNDPALDATSPGAITGDLKKSARTFTCFQQVTRALLALGLDLGSSSDRQLLFKDVSLDVVKGNPRLLSDLSQQSLEIEVAGRGKAATLSVCKKSDTPGYKLADDAYVDWVLRFDESDSKVVSAPRHAPGNLDAVFGTTTLLMPAPPRAPTEDGTDKKEKKDKKKAKADDCRSTTDDSDAPDDPDKVTGSVTFTQRSLEGMVYYIGQNIRRTTSDLPFTDGITYLNDADLRPYEERLFLVDKTSTPRLSAIASIQDRGDFYSIPRFCEEPMTAVSPEVPPPPCTSELPDHASPQILTLLNEVWGLQKSVATLPVTPTVTLIGH